MKKLFTFFAVMFALLGSAIPAHAAAVDWTFYVDTSARPSWTAAYMLVANHEGAYWSCYTGEETYTGSKVYKFSISWENLTYISFSSQYYDDLNGASTTDGRFIYGNDLVGTLSTNNSNDTWKVYDGSCYVLAASGSQLSERIADYTPAEPPSTSPFIYISGGDTYAFTEEGDNWVYTVDASAADVKFRLQTVENYTSSANWTAFYGGTTTLSTTRGKYSETIYLYENQSAVGLYTAPKGYTYKLTIGKSAYENVSSSSTSLEWTITPTEIRPSTPVLPAAAKGNVVEIPAVANGTVYYKVLANKDEDPGDPSTDTWTAYPDGGISLTKGHTYICAAAYANGQWSDVTEAVEYVYTLPVVDVSVNVHTGFATLSYTGTLPEDANPVILYTLGSGEPDTKYEEGKPVDLSGNAANGYSIQAKLLAWGGGSDYTEYVAGTSVRSEVRVSSWAGPAEVRSITLWSYTSSGSPHEVGEFIQQDDESWTCPLSSAIGLDRDDLTQRYFIRVAMNHDGSGDGTAWAPGAAASGVTDAETGTAITGFTAFTPSATDARGIFFAGTNRDNVTLTLSGDLQEYTISGGDYDGTPCKRFEPSSLTPTWNAEAFIKSVTLVDANGKILCTLEQNTDTEEENIWTGTAELEKALGSYNNERFHFVAETKDGTKYYSLYEEGENNANYWVKYGYWDQSTTPVVYTSDSDGYYFCVNETKAIAYVGISFDLSDGTATAISISPYDGSKKMDISGVPSAPKIVGYGSSVGSWTTAREFVKSDSRGGWVYRFTATATTAQLLIFGSQGNLYAPVGLGLGSPTTVWRQIPSTASATDRAKYAAKVSGLQEGAQYRIVLADAGNGDVRVSIEPLTETVSHVKTVELIDKTTGEIAGTLTDSGSGSWELYPLNVTSGNASHLYYLRVTVGLDGSDASDMYRYVSWAETPKEYPLASASQYSDEPVTYTSPDDGYGFSISNPGSYYVQALLDESLQSAVWMGVSTTKLTPAYTPEVSTEVWSLSNDAVLAPGDTKYFYMSAIQNDNRLSPEWELLKQDDGTYKLDNFVVIPAAQFIIRAVTKDKDSKVLSVTDWGYVDGNGTPYHIYATSDFGITDTTEGLTEASRPEATFTMKRVSNIGRGFFWNIGATMVSLVFDPDKDSDNLTATIDFSHPSTLKKAPKPGFPWVGLTSSNIQALRGSNQIYEFAANLGTTGLSDEVLANIGIASADDVNRYSFTNAFIQWTKDGKPYVYGDDVANNTVYYIPGTPTSDNRATTNPPLGNQVMSSTILPPRNTPQFQMISSKGIDTPSADALTFKYLGVETETFERNGSTTKPTRFAVYEIENIELQGMFKVFTGYGARTYGRTVNGLTWYPNWGVGTQNDSNSYANQPISSTSKLPMNGGGQVLENNAVNGEISQKQWGDVNCESKDFDVDDNTAGQYFRLDNSQYVSSLKFYLALESDTDDRNSTLFHNPHASEANYYNDGRNYSWLDVQFEAERPVITLNKQGANTGVVRYWISSPDAEEQRPQITAYSTMLVKVDPDNLKYHYDEEKGEIVFDSGYMETVGGNTYTLDKPYLRYLEEKTASVGDLAEGTYMAFIYNVKFVEEEGFTPKSTDYWNVSQPITVFSIGDIAVSAAQRVTTLDGLNVYHPIARIYPDIKDVVTGLPSDVEPSAVSAAVTVRNIRPDSKLRTVDGAVIPEKSTLEDLASYTGLYYEITQEFEAAPDGTTAQECTAVVYYPKGYFTTERTSMENFDVVDTRVNNTIYLTLGVAVEGATAPASASANAFVYMPAGTLFGELVADKNEGGDVKFNSLAVTSGGDSFDETERDGYARVRFVERDADTTPCYAGSLDNTAVYAQVYYVTEGGQRTPLFGEAQLLDMKTVPESEGAYAAARLKIGGIPYRTDADADDALATDIDGTLLKLRQDQEATFEVQLSYENVGETMPAVNSRCTTTVMTYGSNNLTSPRQGLTDVLTKEDADNRGSGGIAEDVVAVSESFIESYGGLFVNIENAHVALDATGINEDLVGDRSFAQWYMDHGDKFESGESNPFSTAYRMEVGNAKADGTGDYSAASEVHPLLSGSVSVSSAADFRNDSEVNNAWWNTRASVAPASHTDQISGTLSFEGGKAVYTSGSGTPKDQKPYWAGTKTANADAYKVWDGGYVLKVDGGDVDIRDPRHGYYDNASHHTTVRSAYRLGEMPLDANDILALYGDSSDPNSVSRYLGSFEDLRNVAEPIHNTMSEAIHKAVNAGSGTVTVEGDADYDVSVDPSTPWDLDNVWKTRAELAFKQTAAASLGGKSPAEALFDAAGNHMFFKVAHVNHESWFVPGGGVQYDLKTRPIWSAFETDPGFQSAGNDKAKDDWVMNRIRIPLEQYCPLAYDVRYVYPFLTSDSYVTAETASASVHSRAVSRSIATALDGVTADDVAGIVARDKGRVSFFGATEPQYVEPTVISDVADDIRGNGFSIVYNRVAGTVTVRSEGDRQLKDASIYDASGASVVEAATADRIDDRTIVLDVSDIARGAYIVSTNLGGAKFLK